MRSVLRLLTQMPRRRWDVLIVGTALFFGPEAGGLFAQANTPAPTQAAKPDTTRGSAAPDTAAAKIPPEQIEALVAPIALYPDALLAQTLVASTYPLEIIQLQQWLAKHKDLKDQALIDAVAKEPWDTSIQSMAALPEVVERLANDIQWTTDLGNAFLAQQADVMDAVQRMRKKAQDIGALKTNEQQKVETTVVEQKTIIVVESANPEVIYVPSYSPVVVYGPPLYYPYPPIYYPPYHAGGVLIGFGVGMMWGAAWGGSCCGCGWGGNNVNINVHNNFNNNNINNINGGGRGQGGNQGGNWKHNPEHRGGAPYGDKATANKYGGSARGDSPANRAGNTGRQPSQQPGGAGSRPGGAGAGSAGVSNRAGSTGGAGGAGGAGVSDRSKGGNNAGMGNKGGGDQIGNRSIPKQSQSKSGGGFSGGSRGYSGSSARTSSSRGASSMGRGGGGGGGGGRRR